jgi:outer membrane biosynthesis protein TonB
MLVVAALADAPTAAIAVVAIVLGLLFAARGPRDKRGSGAADERAPMMVSMPAGSPAPSAPEPEAEPGFVGPQGEIVGHGPIRLGVSGLSGAGEAARPPPEAVAEPAQPAAAEPAPDPSPTAAVPAAEEPAPPPAEQPPAPSPEQPPAAEPPSEEREPAWRVAARAAGSAVHFRQGTIKLGGRDAGERED